MVASLVLSVGLLPAALGAASAQTIDQFNAANAENRRHTAAETQLRNQATQLRQDQARGLIACQGAGSAAASGACAGVLQRGLQRRAFDLDNRALDEQNTHTNTLRSIGVNPLQ
jgi:hypothetical protein